jgi:hypothetical protein
MGLIDVLEFQDQTRSVLAAGFPRISMLTSALAPVDRA